MKGLLFFTLLWIGGTLNVFSQTGGDLRVFGGVIYGSDVQEVGINAGLEYLISDQIGVAPSLSYYFVDFGSFLSIDIDGRYYFSNTPEIYGLFGLVIERAQVDTAFGSVSDSEAGIDLGAGAIIPIGDKIGFLVQLKVATPGEVQVVGQAGININF